MEIPDPKFNIGDAVKNNPIDADPDMAGWSDFVTQRATIEARNWNDSAKKWMYGAEGESGYWYPIFEENLVLADDRQLDLFTGGERYHGI